MIGLKNRGSLDVTVEDEFENLSAQFRAVFLVEHNEDGSHRASPEVTNFVPSGAIMPYAGATAPNHWLLCDGSQVNRVTYKRLFDVIGTTFGAGDGSTTFNIPDLRQRFILGKAAAGTGSVLGSTGGNIDHTHTGPAHTHSISSDGAHTHTGGAHTHAAGTLAGPSHTHSISNQGGHTHTISGSTANESSHTHGISLGASDVGNEVLRALSPTSPYAQAGTTELSHYHNITGTTGAGSAHSHGAGTLAADSGGSHDHGGATGASGTGSVTGSTASDGAVSTTSNGAHTHTGATGSSGTGTTGTANPPFLTLNHIIKT